MDLQGFAESTLLKDLGAVVYEASQRRGGEYAKLCTDFGIPPDQDIEILISLLESGNDGSSHFARMARELRQLYRDCLLERVTFQGVSPIITCNLLYIHRVYGEYMGSDGEQLLGILTANNDSLIDQAFCHERTYSGLNYGYPFSSQKYDPNSDAPLLLKLHGSFNWRIDENDALTVSDEFESEEDDDLSGWIPPSVFKNPVETPVFREIWGKARELLDCCDILRVIGCSLRNEDIQLLSLLFRSQVSATTSGREPFQIELIIPEESAVGSDRGPGVIDRVRFLSRPKSLSQLYVFREGFDPKNANPYFYWASMIISWIEKKNLEIGNDEFVLQTLFGGNPV